MERKWWENSVVYQIYPKSFYDSNNDGIGDIKGIISKLDYLKYLGIDVIWLSPIYKSPMADNGYDISDYYSIANQFGTMEDMDNLIEEAKKRNIKIIMDLVINHTSDEHQWFIESKSSKDNPLRDYYIWKDPKEDGSEPNNWESVFGGSAWEYDKTTNQYYLHVFAKKQPDLNWENYKVRESLYEMINYWLDKGIGGFRVDAITFIKKGNDFKDLQPVGNEKLVPIGKACLNQKGIDKFLNELKEKTFSKYDIFTVAEAPGVPKEDLYKYAGKNGFFDMLIEFGHADLDIGSDGRWYKENPWTLLDFKKALSESQEVYNEIGFGALYIENHDQPRSLNKYIKKEEDISPISAKMLAISYFFLKGIPFIYQGQEIGMTNVKYESIEDYDDIASIGQYKNALNEGLSKEEALRAIHKRSRDNARTPMQWDNSENAGFTNGKPWLKVNPNYKFINVKSQINDKNSILEFYKKLIKIRKENEIAIYGIYELILEDNTSIYAYTRTLDNKKLLVICNFTNSYANFKLPYNIKFKRKKYIIGNYDDIDSENIIDFNLKPYEARVYILEK